MDKKLRQLRKECLRLSHICQDGNLQSAFSCMEIIWSLYNGAMNWCPEKALDENRDYLVISKGQATLALYAVLIEKKLFDRNDFADMGSFHSRYCIQTDPTKFPEGGIENAAGSLGHGLPFAAGLAMSAKIKHTASMIYVLTGDGEFCEGTMWEACLFAAGKHLDNLCVIIDDNHSAGAMVNMGDMRLKLEAFGLEVFEVDGHNEEFLAETFAGLQKNGKPKAVIADTVRGYGSRTLTDESIWFHKAPNAEEFVMLCKEVDEF